MEAQMVNQENREWYLMYIRVTESKKKEPVFNGPYLGAMTTTKDDAEQEAIKLVNEGTNSTIIWRIFNSERTSTDAAKDHFDDIIKDMVDSHQILSKPTRKKKKKKK